MLSNSLQIIENIEAQIKGSRRSFGKVWLNEEEFFTQVQMLRSQLPREIQAVANISTSLPPRENLLLPIDELERVVENGSGWMGMRGVNEELIFTRLQELRNAFSFLAQIPETPIPRSTTQLGYEEFRSQFDAVFARVANGETFEIVREGQVIARIGR